VLEDASEGRELKLQLRGYLQRAPDPAEAAEDRSEEHRGEIEVAGSDREIPAAWQIPSHLFRHLRGSDHLVFANTRARC